MAFAFLNFDWSASKVFNSSRWTWVKMIGVLKKNVWDVVKDWECYNCLTVITVKQLHVEPEQYMWWACILMNRHFVIGCL